MPTNRRRSGLLFLALAAGNCAASLASAQGLQPVNVIVRFAIDDVRKLYEDDALRKSEKDAAALIIHGVLLNANKVYNAKYPWDFRACDHDVETGRVGMPVPPALRITLSEGSGPSKPWLLEVMVCDQDGITPFEAPAREVIRPSDTDLGLVPIPNPRTIPGLVAEWFENEFLRRDSGDGLLAQLKSRAPIGPGVVLILPQARVPEEAEGLLLLDFLHYPQFTQSRFKVRCKRDAADPVAPIDLYSSGAGRSLLFTRGPLSIHAIVVRHESLDDGKRHPIGEKLGLLPKLHEPMIFFDSSSDAPSGALQPPGPGRLQSSDNLGLGGW